MSTPGRRTTGTRRISFFTRIAVSVGVNAAIALAAGSIALFLGARPSWLLLQRWLMGTVLAGLAVKMVLETKRG